MNYLEEKVLEVHNIYLRKKSLFNRTWKNFCLDVEKYGSDINKRLVKTHYLIDGKGIETLVISCPKKGYELNKYYWAWKFLNVPMGLFWYPDVKCQLNWFGYPKYQKPTTLKEKRMFLIIQACIFHDAFWLNKGNIPNTILLKESYKGKYFKRDFFVEDTGKRLKEYELNISVIISQITEMLDFGLLNPFTEKNGSFYYGHTLLDLSGKPIEVFRILCKDYNSPVIYDKICDEACLTKDATSRAIGVIREELEQKKTKHEIKTMNNSYILSAYKKRV